MSNNQWRLSKIHYINITRREKSSGFMLSSYSNLASLCFLSSCMVIITLSEGLLTINVSFVYDIEFHI